MIRKEDIIGQTQALVLSRLQERSEVDIPAVGRFSPMWHPAYILENEEGRTLIPPHISLAYQPAPYLLNAKHFTTLDQQPPEQYLDPIFVANLSDLHNLDETEATEALTKALQETFEGLFKGRRVALLGLGDLFVTEETVGVLLLNFVPDTALQKSLNAPFSVYKETKLRSDVDFPDLEVYQSRPVEEEAMQYAIQQPEPDSTPLPEEQPESKPEAIAEPTPIATKKSTVEPKKDTKPRHGLWWLLLLLPALGIGYFLWSRPQPHVPTVAPETPIVAVDTTPIVEPESTAPPAPLPLDTIVVPNGGSLATVARKYYDNAFFWVYVYMANADSIPDPNNLMPGQTLVVPSLDQFTIPTDPTEANKEAKRWANLIFNKQFTSYEEQRPTLIVQP